MFLSIVERLFTIAVIIKMSVDKIIIDDASIMRYDVKTSTTKHNAKLAPSNINR